MSHPMKYGRADGLLETLKARCVQNLHRPADLDWRSVPAKLAVRAAQELGK